VKCSIPVPTAPTVFRWSGEGQEVFLSGSFDNWSSRIRMVKRLDLGFLNTYLSVYLLFDVPVLCKS